MDPRSGLEKGVDVEVIYELQRSRHTRDVEREFLDGASLDGDGGVDGASLVLDEWLGLRMADARGGGGEGSAPGAAPSVTHTVVLEPTADAWADVLRIQRSGDPDRNWPDTEGEIRRVIEAFEPLPITWSVVFFQNLGACRRRAPRTRADLKVPKDASRQDLSASTLRFDLALGVRRRHAPKQC